jgi:HEAT repeat protein
MASVSLANGLLEQFSAGNVILFVGDALGEGVPPSARLTSALVDACGAYCDFCREEGRCCKPESCVVPLTRAAQIYESYYNRHTLVTFVQRHLEAEAQPGPIHRAIAALPARVIVTTAHDDRLLTALTDAGRSVSHVVRDTEIPYDDPIRVQLIRLHGSISQPDSLVLTEDDAADLFRRLPTVALILQAHFASKTLLFLGYRLDDPHFLALYRQVTEPIAPHARLAFAVQWPPDEIAARRWQRRIHAIHQKPLDFLRLLSESIHPTEERICRQPLPPEPYKFLDFFTSKDVAIFHGRERDAERVLSLILAHSLSILYGESGTGKTSLIQAAVLPRLEMEGYHIAYTRPLADPLQTVQEAILDALPKRDVTSPDIPNLRAVVENSLPTGGRLLIVLDQFEEFFIRQGPETRSHFIHELVDLLNISDQEVRCLLSLRSEYLDRLDELELPLGRDPLRHRMRLYNLGPAGASAAIAEPAAAFGIKLESVLLEQLLADLEQVGIAPSQLQIVCYVLWQDWQTHGKPKDGLTIDRYLELGGTGAILAGYLDNVIRELEQPDIRDELGLTLDGSVAQEAAQTVLKSMITAERTKVAVSGREITHREIITELVIAPAQVEALLTYLVDKRIIRRLPDSDRYELAHEVMIEKVWEWVSEEERHILDLQDMLARATSDYRKFHSLLPPDRLGLLTEHAAKLSLDEDALELLLVSAIEYDLNTGVWVSRMEKDRAIEVLVELLGKRKRIQYAQIARALGHTRSPKAIRYLQDLLQDESNEIQRSAVDALVNIGLPVVVRPLYYATQREDSLVRVAPIVDALEAIRSDEAISILTLVASGHTNPHVRSRATNAMLRLGYPGSTRLIVRQLHSDDPVIRQNAIAAAKRILEENPDEFRDMLCDMDLEVRLEAIEALKTVGDNRAVAILAQGLQDKDAEVRRASASTLRNLGDARAVEPLLAVLQDEDAEVRRRVTSALGQLGDAQAMEPLAAALRDEDAEVRRRATSALGQLGDARAVEPLAVTLRDEDAEVRRRVTSALGQLGDAQAVEPLVAAALQDEDAEVRRRAASSLAQLGGVEPLLASLQDEDAEVRLSAMAALGTLWELPVLVQLGSESAEMRRQAVSDLEQLRDTRVVEPLAAALQDRDVEVRRRVASALAQLGDARAIEPLLVALQDEDTEVRRCVVDTLAQLGDTRAVEPLLAVLQDDDARVRRQAASSLGKLGDAQAVEPLLLALRDEDAEMRRSAARALGQLRDERAVDPLLAALQDEDAIVRRVAASSLGKLGDAQAVEPLLLALRDEDAEMRRAAASSLGQLGDVRVVEPLLVILWDRNAEVRRQAASALRQLGVLKSLLAMLQDEDVKVRRKGASTLGRLGDVQAVEPLLTALQDESAGVRMDAANALGQLGDVRAVDPLMRVLQDESAGVRMKATIALGQLGNVRAVEPLLVALQDESTRVRIEAVSVLSQL